MLLISIDSASTAVQALSLGRPVSKYSYIFSSKANFNTKYFSEASKVCGKQATNSVMSSLHMIHDLLVSQKFLRAQSKDQHNLCSSPCDLCSLTHYQTTNFRLFQIERVCR